MSIKALNSPPASALVSDPHFIHSMVIVVSFGISCLEIAFVLSISVVGEVVSTARFAEPLELTPYTIREAAFVNRFCKETLGCILSTKTGELVARSESR